MQEHCGPTLTQQHQKVMCLGLWKTVNKPASQPAPTRASGAPIDSAASNARRVQ